MRPFSPAFETRLAEGATTLCFAWRVTLDDARTLGFTDHDEDITFDGVVFRAQGGFAAGDADAAAGASVDAAAVMGALDGEAIDPVDIAAGLWDGARVEQWRLDWRDPSMRVLLFAGTIGAVRATDSGFEAELLGLGAALDAPFGRVLSRHCDAMLGDARCGFDLGQSGFHGAGAVVEVLGPRAFRADGLASFADQWFTRGVLTWTGGLQSEIVVHRKEGAVAYVEVRDATSAITQGAAFTLAAGCDKLHATCRAKFTNVANFRGFPHMPGDDAMLAGVGAQAPMDGGSRWR